MLALTEVQSLGRAKEIARAHTSRGLRVALLSVQEEWRLFRTHRSELNRVDLREKWPFSDASVSHVYSEHVFEHFELQREVTHFLSEARRVLQPGGIFDVGVPDTEWPLRAYGNPDDPYWPFAKAVHPEWCETQLDHINYHFRQGTEHKYAWDFETLARTLRSFGFTDIARRECDPERDSESRRIGTLYMTAVKTQGLGLLNSWARRFAARC
jgi:predicted SAM-dependent methyltransferase